MTNRSSFGFDTFDSANTANDGIYSLVSISDGGATTGTLDTSGVFTQFSFNSVPEPSVMLAALGLAGLVFMARRAVALREASCGVTRTHIRSC